MNLEKCPFCGSMNLELEEDATVICNDTEVWVQCLGCGACGPRVHLGYRIEDENSSQIDLKAEATETWRIRFVTGSQFWSGDEGKPQDVIERWVRRVIGDQALTNRSERGLRVAEEAIELAQAMGVSVAEMNLLVAYVFSRPVGDPAQEIAGTMVTLYAAAACIGTDAEKAFETECARIHTPEIEERVRRRQTEKRERMLAAVGPMEQAPEKEDDAVACRAHQFGLECGWIGKFSELTKIGGCPMCGGKVRRLPGTLDDAGEKLRQFDGPDGPPRAGS